jgi:hypothetical protein
MDKGFLFSAGSVPESAPIAVASASMKAFHSLQRDIYPAFGDSYPQFRQKKVVLFFFKFLLSVFNKNGRNKG